MTDKFIPLQRTVFTEVDLVHAIQTAYKALFNEDPFIQQIGIFWAHFCIECGKGKQCFNWNIGNIKYSKGHDYTMYRCGEIIGGKQQYFDPPHPQTWFRSYPSLQDAVQEHLKFLKLYRYSEAFDAAKDLNPELYVENLKKGGYFTANLDSYKAGVRRLFDEFMEKYADEVEMDPYA